MRASDRKTRETRALSGRLVTGVGLKKGVHGAPTGAESALLVMREASVLGCLSNTVSDTLIMSANEIMVTTLPPASQVKTIVPVEQSPIIKLMLVECAHCPALPVELIIAQTRGYQ